MVEADRGRGNPPPGACRGWLVARFDERRYTPAGTRSRPPFRPEPLMEYDMSPTPRERPTSPTRITRATRTVRRPAVRLASVAAGAAAAAAPVLAVAADEQGRVLEQNENFGMIALVTLLTAGGILLLASLGRMYQRQRGIRWRFQDPDAPADGHESGH
jgi:hypothetical protein